MTTLGLADALLNSTPEDTREAERRARKNQPWLGFLIVAFMVAAAIFTSLLAKHVMTTQERRLLDQRSGDLQAVAISNFSQAETNLETTTAAIAIQNDQIAAFAQAATPLVSAGNYAYAALVNIRAANPTVLSSLGSGSPANTVLTNDPAQAIEAAVAHPGQLSTTPVINTGTTRRIGGVIYTPSTLPNTVVYLERTVASFNPQALFTSTQFTDVQIAFYAGNTPTSDNLIFATTHNVPLHGLTVEKRPTIGLNGFLLVASARPGLIGTVATIFPLIILLSGLMAAGLAAAIILVLRRRRQYALALVDKRTQALETSMEALRQRAALDALLRRASRDIANAAGLTEAIQSLHTLIREIVPLDRLALLTMERGSLVVVARAGIGGSIFPEGFTFPMDAPSMDQVLNSTGAALLDLHEYEPYNLDMKSVITVTLAAAGEARTVMTLSAAQENAYKESDLPLIEAIGRETSGVINQLLLRRTERETTKRFQELDQLKNEFVGIVAHDLRSPMTVIAGFADLLRTNANYLTEDERQEYLDRISGNIKNLAELVEDILQVARIESGELTVEVAPFNLADLVRRTVEEISEIHEHHTYLLDIPDDLPLAHADEQRQWQILSNLFSNAFKYSPNEKPVEVSVRYESPLLVVRVRDHGIGIRQQDLPRIFEKFSRVPQPGGGKVAGTGLGLYIARSLVESQGGHIQVESTEGEGTTFHYTVTTVEANHGLS